MNWKFCADSGTALLFFARPKLRPRSGLFRRARPGQITTRSGLGLRLTKKFTSQDLKISSGLLHKIFFPALSDQVPASAVCSKGAAFAPPPLQGLCFSLSLFCHAQQEQRPSGSRKKKGEKGRKQEESRGPNRIDSRGVPWGKGAVLGEAQASRAPPEH